MPFGKYTRVMQRATIRWSWAGLTLLVLILVPFAIMDESVAAMAERWVQAGTGRVLVAVAVPVLLAMDVVLPVPSSVVATASGSLLGLGQGAAVSWVGFQLGAAIGYVVGRAIGVRVVRRLVGPTEMDRAEQAHRRWGAVSLLACRAVPVLAESSVMVAGAVRMPFGQFAWLTGLSNVAVALVYAWVGAYALETRALFLAFLASLAVPGVLMVAYRAVEFGSCQRVGCEGQRAGNQRSERSP